MPKKLQAEEILPLYREWMHKAHARVLVVLRDLSGQTGRETGGVEIASEIAHRFSARYSEDEIWVMTNKLGSGLVTRLSRDTYSITPLGYKFITALEEESPNYFRKSESSNIGLKERRPRRVPIILEEIGVV